MVARILGPMALCLLSSCGGGGGAKSFLVSAAAGPGGSVSPAGISVGEGSTAVVTVTANDGYEISEVTGCGGTLAGNRYTTGPVTSACTVSASFRLKRYTVSTSFGVGGGISPTSTIVDHGSTTTFTITPSAGFEISAVTGCAGVRSGSSYTTGAVTGPCSISVEFNDVRVTTSGVIYERLDTEAYGSSYVPVSGVSGATVKLRSGAATSQSNGAFSVKFEPVNKPDADDLSVEAIGYAAGSWPWRDVERISSQSLGLYRSIPIKPRPGFVGGVIPHDVGGIYVDVYKAGLFPPTMQRGRIKAGSNLVTLVDTIEVTEIDVAGAVVGMKGAPPWPNKFHPDISAKAIYSDLVSNARSRGLSVMMMIAVYPDVPVIDLFFSEITKISPGSTAFWEAWFSKFKPLVIERAAVARDLNMEYLVLGLNQYYMNSFAPYSRWADLIKAIRDVGYKGKIGVFDGDFEGRKFSFDNADALKFTELFDFLGLSVYAVVKPQFTGEVLAREQTRSRMRADIRALLNKHQGYSQPLIVLMGTPSVHGGASSDEYIEPCLLCNSIAPSRVRDLQQQADAYQAMFEVINERPVGAGQVMGFLSWGYHYRDDPTRVLATEDGTLQSYDKSGSVRGKPAEAVMKHWLDGFTK